nr:hypothetical protein CFP56_30892 [Quercus suber]
MECSGLVRDDRSFAFARADALISDADGATRESSDEGGLRNKDVEWYRACRGVHYVYRELVLNLEVKTCLSATGDCQPFVAAGSGKHQNSFDRSKSRTSSTSHRIQLRPSEALCTSKARNAVPDEPSDFSPSPFSESYS